MSYFSFQIYDGLLDTDPLLGRFCSTADPPPVTTSGPYARIYFHSDASLSDTGFHITYTAVPGEHWLYHNPQKQLSFTFCSIFYVNALSQHLDRMPGYISTQMPVLVTPGSTSPTLLYQVPTVKSSYRLPPPPTKIKPPWPTHSTGHHFWTLCQDIFPHRCQSE